MCLFCLLLVGWILCLQVIPLFVLLVFGLLLIEVGCFGKFVGYFLLKMLFDCMVGFIWLLSDLFVALMWCLLLWFKLGWFAALRVDFRDVGCCMVFTFLLVGLWVVVYLWLFAVAFDLGCVWWSLVCWLDMFPWLFATWFGLVFI